MIRMRGPQQMLSRAPATPTAYREKLVAKARKRGMTPRVSGAQLVAYVNHGRWVADCPRCRGGIAVHPEWEYAACFDCMTAYTDIRVPDAWPAIERALDARPEAHQNWLPGETVDQLRDENRAHGVAEVS